MGSVQTNEGKTSGSVDWVTTGPIVTAHAAEVHVPLPTLTRSNGTMRESRNDRVGVGLMSAIAVRSDQTTDDYCSPALPQFRATHILMTPVADTTLTSSNVFSRFCKPSLPPLSSPSTLFIVVSEIRRRVQGPDTQPSAHSLYLFRSLRLSPQKYQL